MQIVYSAFSEFCPQPLQQFAAGVSYLSNQAGKIFDNAISDLTKALKSTDNIDTTLRVVSEWITLYNVVQAIQQAARPILSTLDTFRTVISTNRIWGSLKYITSGELCHDIVVANIPTVISEAAFFAARSINAAVWLNTHKIIGDDAFARISTTVGNFSASLGMPKISRNALVEGLFAVALVPCAIQRFQKIEAGEEIPYNLMELVSLCADIALSVFAAIRESQVLEMVGTSLCTSVLSFVVANPYVLATLGVIAATTGFFAIFLNPSSSK